MRLHEDQIKRAILNDDEEIRHTAVCWFSEGFSSDQSIMPLVLDAAKTYGPAATWQLVREAQWLSQTEATVEALMRGLDCRYDPNSVGQDNYRFALALAPSCAPVELGLAK